MPTNILSAERFDEDTSFGLTHSDPVLSDADRSLLGFFKMDPSPINPLIAVEAKVWSHIQTFTLFTAINIKCEAWASLVNMNLFDVVT